MNGIYTTSKEKQLLDACDAFSQESLSTIVMGAELEFYLVPPFSMPLATLEEALTQECQRVLLPVSALEKEKGHNQYEYQLSPTSPWELAKQLTLLRKTCETVAKHYDAEAVFSAKPYADQPGSALHVHVHLEDAEQHNLFGAIDNYTKHNPYLWHSLGGLMALLPASMVAFAPLPEDYQRYKKNTQKEAQESPTTVSWGGNNRTLALRIPTSSPLHRRIEHRVPSASAEPYAVLIAIVKGLAWGLAQKLSPPPRIYGNATDSQYQQEPLPASLEEAEKNYRECEHLLKMDL